MPAAIDTSVLIALVHEESGWEHTRPSWPRRADPGRVEEVVGRATPLNAAEVAVGPGHRLCAEQLGGTGASPGARLPGYRQQPELRPVRLLE